MLLVPGINLSSISPQELFVGLCANGEGFLYFLHPFTQRLVLSVEGTEEINQEEETPSLDSAASCSHLSAASITFGNIH